jgi:hypothetical protein
MFHFSLKVILMSFLCPLAVLGMELKGVDVKFIIDEKNGELQSGGRVDQLNCLIGSEDYYILENQEEKIQIFASEDIVKTSKQGDSGEIIFECENPRLGNTQLIKTYKIVDGMILSKRLDVRSNGVEGFFTWSQGIKLSPEFRKNAYYYRIKFSLTTPGPMILDAAKTNHGCIASSRVACVDRESLNGVGYYVYTVNDKWTYDFQYQLNSTFTPFGWQMMVSEDYISREKSFSAEIHLPLFIGDHLTFNEIYIRQPVVHSTLFRKRPSWIRDVVGILNYSPWYFSRNKTDQSGVEQTAKHFADGYIMMTFMMGWCHTPGYYSAEGKIGPDGSHTADTIRQIIKKAKDLSGGRYKIGLYTTSLVISTTPPAKEHPEWRMLDKNGQAAFDVSTENEALLYWWNFSLPEVKKYFSDQYYNLANKYDIDYLFIDIGSHPGMGPQDWLHRDVFQSFDNYDAVGLSMARAAESVKDREVGTMGNSPCAPPFDFTYLEHGIASDWKQNSAMCQFGKFMECTGSRMCLLGWDTTRVYAQEYLLALGLVPAQFSPAWILNDIPVFEAAYEMRTTRLVDGIIKPRWWLDGSDIECYGLQQGKAKFITTIGHRPTTTQVNVVIDPAKFGLAKGADIYLWEHIPFNRRIFRGMTNVDTNELQLQMPAVNEGAAILTFSDVPAVIYSINDRPCRILMSEQPDILLDGTLDQIKGEVILTVDTKKKKIEVLAYYPEEQGEPVVFIDDQQVPAETVKIHRQDGERFLLIPVTQSKHNIRVTYNPSKPDKRTMKYYEVPTATIKGCGKPPVLDGILNDTCWQSATEIGNFVMLGSGKPMPETLQTFVKVTYDKENLYLGWTVMQPDTPSLVVMRKEHNDIVFTDPSIEIFLDTTYSRNNYFHVISNVDGFMLTQEMDFECKIFESPIAQVKTHKADDRWFAEMVIPFKNLGLSGPPSSGTKWGVNMGRTRPAPESSWSWTRGYGFHAPALFGTWIFE